MLRNMFFHISQLITELDFYTCIINGKFKQCKSTISLPPTLFLFIVFGSENYVFKENKN